VKRSHDDKAWWLSRDQGRLLLTAFGDETVALEAWNEWSKRGSIATLEPGSMELVPLVYRRLSSLGRADRQLPTFKGVYRRTWYHNQLILRDLAIVLARFREARIQAVMPADVSILLTSYHDIGSRRLDGLGVLVDPDQAEAAADVLLATGWRHNLPGAFRMADLDRTSLWFHQRKDKHLELRWALGTEPSSRAEYERTWSRTIPTSVLGEEAPALSFTEQLLATRQAGCWHPIQSARWVGDALTVLARGRSPLDWDRVIAFSQRSRTSLWAYSRWLYLKNQWSVPVPAHVLEAIDRVPKSVIDRVEYGVRRSRIPISTDSVAGKALLRMRRCPSPRIFLPRLRQRTVTS
jgi:hypothetical protein